MGFLDLWAFPFSIIEFKRGGKYKVTEPLLPVCILPTGAITGYNFFCFSILSVPCMNYTPPLSPPPPPSLSSGVSRLVWGDQRWRGGCFQTTLWRWGQPQKMCPLQLRENNNLKRPHPLSHPQSQLPENPQIQVCMYVYISALPLHSLTSSLWPDSGEVPKGQRGRVLYGYEAKRSDEISLEPGQVRGIVAIWL